VIEIEDAEEKILTVGRQMGVEFRVLGFSGLNVCNGSESVVSQLNLSKHFSRSALEFPKLIIRRIRSLVEFLE